MSDPTLATKADDPAHHGSALRTAEDPAGAPAPAVAGSPRKIMALVMVAAVGMYIMSLTLSTALSLRLASIDPASKDATYSTAVSISAFGLLIAAPLAGALSDRTTGRFGRRRPWIAGCLLVALLGCAVIGTVTSAAVVVVAYLVAILGAQVGFNTYAVIPVEGLPEHKRGRVMGVMGMFGALAFSAGSYLASGLVGVPLLMMTVPVLLAIAFSLPLLFLYKDPVKFRGELPPLDVKAIARTFVVNPRRHPDFAWVWLSRLLAGIAMTAMFSYFVYFMMDGLHMPIAEAGANAGTLSLISAPVSMLFFTGSGWLADKTGRRKPLVAIAAVLMALALVIGATSTTFAQFTVAWVVFAVGQATYLTTDLALCAAVLPDARDTGKDMAVFGLALNIPNILVPAAAPTVLALGAGHNYRLLWFGAAALCLLGSITVTFVKGAR
ncbi:MFS family permease [Streptomyces sp. 3330]|uniref:MFS transporter n=1 Tax=Streptomyces sp. 3330 TaxID=2817755 RepID=UPI00285CD7C8|nr:MFS transporter [Streptomyces sp. 3330]MDR6976001.1 MFS family permease [Streptomyces sp. 3330]